MGSSRSDYVTSSPELFLFSLELLKQHVLRELQGCFKEVNRKFQGGFKEM